MIVKILSIKLFCSSACFQRRSVGITSLVFTLFLVTASILVCAQDYKWAKGIGGVNNDRGNGIVVDKAGNVYITGYYSGEADFDPSVNTALLTSIGAKSMFIAKYDTKGNYVWAKNITGKGNAFGQSITLDTTGNLYISGYLESININGILSGTVDFDPGPLSANLTVTGKQVNSCDAFVSKYDTSGNYIWAKGIGGGYLSYGMSIAVDGLGNVLVTGNFAGTIDFDPGSAKAIFVSVWDSPDIFIAKYDASGNYVWAKGMGDGGVDLGNSITTDKNGNVYVSGIFWGTVDFNSDSGVDTLTSTAMLSGSPDVFIAKYNPDGNYIWAKNVGGPEIDEAYGISVDKAGDVYVTGSYRGSADFDPDQGSVALITSVGTNGFVAKYDSNGKYIWVNGIEGTNVYNFGISVDVKGNTYVTGHFYNFLSFKTSSGGSDNFTSVGGYDMFVAKYDISGKYVWTKNVGGAGTDQGSAIDVSSAGEVYVTGYFYQKVDFDPGVATDTLTAVGSSDIFVLKLSCSDTSSSYWNVALCGEASYTLNGEVYTTSGTYFQRYPNAIGCDSTLVLELNLKPMTVPVIVVEADILKVNTTYATYQWLQEGAVVPEATESTYKVAVNGAYQVVVSSENGCVDTSEIYQVSSITVIGTASFRNNGLILHPNPNAGTFQLTVTKPLKHATLRLINLLGQEVWKLSDANGNVFSFDIVAQPSGVYALEITEDGKNSRLKLIKAK